MAQKLTFLGMTDDGKFKYEKGNGKVFTSKRNLHEKKDGESDDTSKKVHEIIKSDKVEETNVDELAASFGNKMGKGSKKYPASTLKDVFGSALKDVADKNVTEEQVQDVIYEMLENG